MDLNQKKQVVSQIKEDFTSASSVVITHYSGLTVEEITKLRNNLRELGARFKVTKNSLAKLALKDTVYEQLSDLFVGPTGVAFSQDPVSAAKGIVNFAKENEKLVILGGAISDQRMEIDRIEALAKLPSVDELRGKIVGLLSTPASRIASVLQAPGGQLARVLNAYSQKS